MADTLPDVSQPTQPLERPGATFGDWFAGARIRTLPVSVAPVAMGTAAVAHAGADVRWGIAALCLLVALAIQIGANYANDYSDGVRGTDEHRVGPSRLTGSGAASPRTVLAVALAFFGLAAVAGLVVVVLSGHWWLLVVGLACVLAAWFYVGGKHPYGYFGLGEAFAFTFFGPVAVLGTMYVQTDTISWAAWLLGIGGGLLTCGVLVANNIRDIDQDREAGKRTLSVIIGRGASRVLYCVLLLVPFGLLAPLILDTPPAAAGLIALAIAVPACVRTVRADQPRQFLASLKLASLTALVYGLAIAVAVLVVTR